MAGRTEKKLFTGETDYAVSPGETLLETLEYIGMTQRELAVRLGLTPKTINEIAAGKAPLTAATATGLEAVLNVPAEFWLRMEALYRADLERLAARKGIEGEKARARSIPYASMVKNGWVPAARAEEERVLRLRSFFKVASLERIDFLEYAVSFGGRERAASSRDAVFAWLQRGENLGRDIRTAPYSGKKLLGALPELRALTLTTDETLAGGIAEICAGCGVAVAFVEPLPQTSLCGAVRWLTPEKALIALSLRGKRLDGMWFTLFHQIGHIVKGHGKKRVFLTGEDEKEALADERSDHEREADDFARDALVPAQAYREFREGSDFSPGAVGAFSERIGIHPSIVYGRLAMERALPSTHVRKHRVVIGF